MRHQKHEFIALNMTRVVNRARARMLEVEDKHLHPVNTRAFAQITIAEAWLEVSLGRRLGRIFVGEWTAAFRLAVQNGQVVVAELRLFPFEGAKTDLDLQQGAAGTWSGEILGMKAHVPRGGITARLLRRIPFNRIREVVERCVKFAVKEYGSAIVGLPFSDWKGKTIPEETRRRGRPGWPDHFYARLARRYATLVRKGRANPVAELSKALHIPHPQIRDAIKRAREKGFLTEGLPGRAGGELTPKASELLDARKPRS
jgi:hypothetical protein